MPRPQPTPATLQPPPDRRQTATALKRAAENLRHAWRQQGGTPRDLILLYTALLRPDRPHALRPAVRDRLHALIDDLDLPADPTWLADLHPVIFMGEPSAARRRRTGSFYTPADVVEGLLDRALEPILDRPQGRIRQLRVGDPACGSGRFLLAAAHRIADRLVRQEAMPVPIARAHAVATCIHGVDLCPVAVALCRLLLGRYADWAPPAQAALARNIRCADALDLALDPAQGWGGFDLVVGNPPFQNQLDRATARDPRRARRLAARFPGLIRPYTDTAAAFLALGLELVQPGGRIAMIQPISTLATRDAGPIRSHALRVATLEHLWIAGQTVFDASVAVVAPVLHAVGPARPGARVTRTTGRAFAPADAAPHPALPDQPDAAPHDDGWASLADTGTDRPALIVPPDAPTIAELASATADFRDQYYGLRGLIVEHHTIDPDELDHYPILVTSGLIDPAHLLWGHRPTRVHKQSWHAPRVDLRRLRLDPALARWADQRLVPKILLATQTPVLELVIDERGDFLPAVPVITITPHRPADLYRLAALLALPATSAIARQRHAGAGLSAGAIKLSARQVLALPQTLDGKALDRAADAIRRATHAATQAQRAGALRELAIEGESWPPLAARGPMVTAWWARRLPSSAAILNPAGGTPRTTATCPRPARSR